MVKCRDFNNITLDFNGCNPLIKYKTKKELIGFDTETEKGKCFLIGYYNNKKDYHIKVINEFQDVMDFLFNLKFRKTFNFFYNITYDFNAIIKHLPYKNLVELSRYDKTYYEDYLIKIIPNKMFSISKNKHKVIFYDLAQFYNFMSLNKAGEKFLNLKKQNLKDEGIDIKKLSLDEYNNNPNYRKILNKYLYRDVEITKRLSDKLYKMVTPYIYPKSFYSQASFSQQYYLENIKRKIILPKLKILDYALKSYQGGRFETFQRGYFKKTYVADIKSAYPYHNIQIPNLSKGKWINNKEYEEESLVSIFKTDINIYDISISPLKYQLKDNLMIYPNGKFKDIFINKQEYDLVNKLGFKIKIKDAFHYLDKEPEYPYLFLKKFYDLKEKYKNEGKKELSWIPKIIINGFYGKTIQLTPTFRYTKKDEGLENLHDIITHKNEEIYIYKTYQAGKLFNPIVANEITANTRVQLYNSSLKNFDNIIGFQTDSIISDKKLNLDYSNKLGSWELENKGESIILGSGVYQIIGDTPKMRLRGFQKGMDLKSLLEDNLNKDKIEISLTRNNKLKKTIKMKEQNNKLLTIKDKIELFNLIIEDKKTININFDKKRVWERDFLNCKDVLENQILSKPLYI